MRILPSKYLILRNVLISDCGASMHVLWILSDFEFLFCKYTLSELTYTEIHFILLSLNLSLGLICSWQYDECANNVRTPQIRHFRVSQKAARDEMRESPCSSKHCPPSHPPLVSP